MAAPWWQRTWFLWPQAPGQLVPQDFPCKPSKKLKASVSTWTTKRKLPFPPGVPFRIRLPFQHHIGHVTLLREEGWHESFSSYCCLLGTGQIPGDFCGERWWVAWNMTDVPCSYWRSQTYQKKVTRQWKSRWRNEEVWSIDRKTWVWIRNFKSQSKVF